jgi:hypothetical protein
MHKGYFSISLRKMLFLRLPQLLQYSLAILHIIIPFQLEGRSFFFQKPGATAHLFYLAHHANQLKVATVLNKLSSEQVIKKD